MRKRLLSTFFFALCACVVWAQETITVDSVVYELDAVGQTARATGLEETSVSRVIIPQTVTSGGKAYAVTSIGANAFRDTRIESVTLPEGLKVIEAFAFSGCTRLFDIILPASLDSIGESAFSNMRSTHFYFRSETAPACQGDPFIISQDDYYRTNGIIFVFTSAANPFQTDYRGFDQLIPDNIYLSILPWSGIDEAHNFVFAVNETEQTACVVRYNLWSDVVDIPASVEFEGRQYTVTSIRRGAYSPSGIYFSDYYTIRSLSLPSTLEIIGDYAFAMSFALMSVDLPASLRYVGDYAFDGCFIGEDYHASIEPQGSIHIPASVDSIGFNAFYVKHITVDPTNKHYDSRDNCDGVIRTADNTLVFTAAAFDEIPASVEGVGRQLFQGSNRRQISLPAGLKRIEDYAFAGCRRLQSITLPEGLQSIGSFAFAACDSIRSLRIPASVKKIDYAAFGGCILLSDIEVDVNNTVYDSREQCNAIVRTADNTLVQGALLPNAVRAEGQTMFDADTLFIPATVERVESYAYGFPPISIWPRVEYTTSKFYKSNPWYGMVVLPSSLKSMGSGAFNGLYFASEAAMLGDSMELYDTTPQGEHVPFTERPFLRISRLYGDIDDETLSLMNDLNITVYPFSSLIIDGRYYVDRATMTATVAKGWVDSDGECHVPESVDLWGMHFTLSAIGTSAFWRNTDLQAVFLPVSITSIGEGAFRSSSLERIEGTEQVTWVGWRAFEDTPWIQVAPTEGGVVYVGHCAYTFDKTGETPTSISLREGTTQVVEEAFRDLNFTELTLPASVKSIGRNAINRTVTTIYSYIREPFELPNQRWGSAQLRRGEVTCYVPHGTLEAYQTQSIWNQLVLVDMEPQTLSGNIAFTETEFVYSGQPFTPEWHFTNEAYQDLVLDEDYTISWSNNVLPGTATLTVTGKGNYTGSLTAIFQIDKAPLRADLYSLSLPAGEYIYDEHPHGASIEVADGVGVATISYTENNSGATTAVPPTVPGAYDIYLTIADGDYYYGMEKTLMGHVNIKLYDEEKYMLAQQMASDTETYHMYYQTHQALTDFVDNAAAALASGDLHSVYVAFLPIDDRLEEAQASYEKYQLLADYIAAASRIQNAYSPFFTDEINASVRATIENLQTAYERGTLTNEEIREVWPQFQEEIRSDLSATFTPYIEPGNTLMSQGLIEDIHNRFAQALQEIQTLLNKAEYSVNDANYINGLYTRVRSLVTEAQANVSDLAILRQAYNAMGGAGKLAGYWQFETAPYKLNGVTFNAGQATQITLENKNLTSGVPTAFFMLPKLNSLNLSHNNMTGNIAQVWQQLTASGKTSPLASLNISYNQLSGNIGLIGQVCTELRQLNASHNHLTECLPMLCNNISNVDLSYQALDWTWNFMLDETQDNMQLLPQILRYDRQATDGQAASQSFTCTVGEWSMKLGYANEQLTVVAPAGQAYVGAKGTLMDATLTTSTATGSTFQLQFNFLDGDANFSGMADVLDLQSIINYMFNDWQRSAFNFTASNLYNDEIINVQDVVLMVEKLLSVNKPNNKRKNARTSEEENLDATDAYLYWSGNDLILNTVTGVTAADISFLGDASFKWELRQMGFTVTEKKDANGMHVVIYSLTGAEIPAGETVIARKTAGNAEPVNALFADHEAAAVSVCFSESEATPTSRLMATEGQWRIFRTDGTIVAYGTGQAQLRSASRRLTTGIYILQGENNKTQKFTIK